MAWWPINITNNKFRGFKLEISMNTELQTEYRL